VKTIHQLIARVKALAAFPIHIVTWGLVVAFSGWIAIDLTLLQLSSGLSQTTYDAMVRNRFYAAAPDPRLVIVDIDEASLARMSKEFGRWPWPRDTLASVQDFLEKEQPAAIVWDIMFADADRVSPGGDAAFNASAKRSPHSHYSVIRLPPANDSKSALTREHLPNLWVQQADLKSKPATVAAIVPFLPNVAAGSLGFNNGYPDSDGVLRRYRYSETLLDGSVIQSTPLSVVRSIANDLSARLLAAPKNLDKHGVDAGTLIAWRKTADAYPKISFADVFEKAEGVKTAVLVPSFKGKVVVIGGTAPSLHDIHPTPLASFQPGVESLATAIDNAINARFIAEVPRLLQALIAIGLCVGLAFWVRRFGIASLDGALVILPIALLGISYLSLNFSSVFIDLQLAAGAVLLFLAAVRTWNKFRRGHWCDLPIQPLVGEGKPSALMVLRSDMSEPFTDRVLDHLIDLLEKNAFACRVVGGDASYNWPAKLFWPEMVCFIGVAGPQAQLIHLQKHLPINIKVLDMHVMHGSITKTTVANTFFRSYL
jgi:adenylate cyclase